METTTRARNGILKELLRTPVLKDIIRLNLNEMSPSTGSHGVKTFMGEDPEVFLSLVSSIPGLINVLTRAALELGFQLKDKFPAETLLSYLETLYEDIDRVGMRECGKTWASLIISLWKASGDLREKVKTSILLSGPEVVAEALNTLARSINIFHRDNPGSMSTFISEVLRNIDQKEVSLATQTLAGAFLDQKWHLVSWVWQLTWRRIRNRLGI
jgi:hypothetical protein